MLATIINKNNRTAKYNLFLRLFKPQKNDLILDVEVNNIEFSDVDNFLEKNYLYLGKITVDDNAEFELKKISRS